MDRPRACHGSHSAVRHEGATARGPAGRRCCHPGAGYGPGSPGEGWDHTVPPIERVFGQSLGMDVSIIAAEFTLASRVPARAPLRDKARADLEAARRAATDLAVQLGRRLLGDQ